MISFLFVLVKAPRPLFNLDTDVVEEHEDANHQDAADAKGV